MGVKAGSAAAAIDNARALMDALLASDWAEIHVRNGETELFIARAEGGSNPMRTAVSLAEDTLREQQGPGVQHAIKAPHVATLVSVAMAGSWVEQGAPVARLSVLDEEEDLNAPISGRVSDAHRNPGDLVEFGDTLLTIGEAV